MSARKQIPSYRQSLRDRLRRGGRRRRFWAERFLAELSDYAMQLHDASQGELPIGWLLPFRPDLRHLIADEIPTAFARFLRDDDSRDDRRDLRPLAIWLLSRHATRSQLLGIDRYRYDDSPAMRKHVAKALWRLEAWSQLEEMAEALPDDRQIQRFAAAATMRRPFAARLERFADSVDQSRAPEAALASRMPVWSREAHWRGAPAKSRLYIRSILLRIRRWVRGGIR